MNNKCDFTYYCGTIEEAVRIKNDYISKGYTIIGEKTGKSAPGYWVCLYINRPADYNED